MPTTPDQYAVFGNPISHSKSPQIHREFARATDQLLTYCAIEAPLDGFAQSVESFRQGGGCGCNVTVPFKGVACELADELSEDAVIAGAVNTLQWDESGRLLGFNTDGKGLLRDLQDNLGIDLIGLRILIIGAGGAAAGVIAPLLRAQPQQLVVINRTISRAVGLVAQFSQLSAGVLSVAPVESPGSDYDLVINATSAGLSGQVPTLPTGLFAEGGRAYDLVYADRPTAFMTWALTQGAATVSDGLGMLVEQAAEAFFIWRGMRPATARVILSLRG